MITCCTLGLLSEIIRLLNTIFARTHLANLCFLILYKLHLPCSIPRSDKADEQEKTSQSFLKGTHPLFLRGTTCHGGVTEWSNKTHHCWAFIDGRNLFYKSNKALEVVHYHGIMSPLWLSLVLGLRPRTYDLITAVTLSHDNALPLMPYSGVKVGFNSYMNYSKVLTGTIA